MPGTVKLWDHCDQEIEGYLDLGFCIGLANKEYHQLYAFPSKNGIWQVGARFGPDGDYHSMSTSSMGGPVGLATTLEFQERHSGGSEWYLEIYEAHKRLYETQEYKDSQK